MRRLELRLALEKIMSKAVPSPNLICHHKVRIIRKSINLFEPLVDPRHHLTAKPRRRTKEKKEKDRLTILTTLEKNREKRFQNRSHQAAKKIRHLNAIQKDQSIQSTTKRSKPSDRSHISTRKPKSPDASPILIVHMTLNFSCFDSDATRRNSVNREFASFFRLFC